MKKAHVTHPELKVTLHLDIIGVKKNPNGQSYTQLGVLTKGTIIEVNVSALGLVTPGGKVVWGKYAQVGNCRVSKSLDWRPFCHTWKVLTVSGAPFSHSSYLSKHGCESCWSISFLGLQHVWSAHVGDY